jgi:hypothetical protein
MYGLDTLPSYYCLMRIWIVRGVLSLDLIQNHRHRWSTEIPAFGHAAKKQRYDSAPLILQLAWLKRAEQLAKTVMAKSFSTSALTS